MVAFFIAAVVATAVTTVASNSAANARNGKAPRPPVKMGADGMPVGFWNPDYGREFARIAPSGTGIEGGSGFNGFGEDKTEDANGMVDRIQFEAALAAQVFNPGGNGLDPPESGAGSNFGGHANDPPIRKSRIVTEELFEAA